MNIELLIKEKSKQDLQKVCTELEIVFDAIEVKRSLAERIRDNGRVHPSLVSYYEPSKMYTMEVEKERKAEIQKEVEKSPLALLQEECTERGIEFKTGYDANKLKSLIAQDDTNKIEAAELNSLQAQAKQLGVQFEGVSKEYLFKLVAEASNKLEIEMLEAENKAKGKEESIKRISEMEVDIEFLNDLADYVIVACRKMQKQLIASQKNGDRFFRAAQEIERLKKSCLIK